MRGVLNQGRFALDRLPEEPVGGEYEVFVGGIWFCVALGLEVLEELEPVPALGRQLRLGAIIEQAGSLQLGDGIGHPFTSRQKTIGSLTPR
jgi:hypothetical protein